MTRQTRQSLIYLKNFRAYSNDPYLYFHDIFSSVIVQIVIVFHGLAFYFAFITLDYHPYDNFK